MLILLAALLLSYVVPAVRMLWMPYELFGSAVQKRGQWTCSKLRPHLAWNLLPKCGQF